MNTNQPTEPRALTPSEIAAGRSHSQADIDAAPPFHVFELKGERIAIRGCNCPFCDGSREGYEINAES